MGKPIPTQSPPGAAAAIAAASGPLLLDPEALGGIAPAPGTPGGSDDDMSHLVSQHAVTARQPGALIPKRIASSSELVGDDDPDDELAQLRRDVRELDRAKEIQALKSELHERKRQLKKAQEAYEAVPKADPVRDAPTTYILMPQDVGEEKLAKAWIEEHCPIKLEQQAIESVLDIGVLRKDDAIVCMIRGAKTGAPVPRNKATRDQATGAIMSDERDKFELFADITLTPAVYVKDHWSIGTGLTRHMGELSRSSLVNTLGPLCSPQRLVWLDANEAVKGRKAQFLVLRDC